MEIYVVQRGDTAWAIARRFDVPLERLIADNQLGEEAALTVGQALLIRGEERERERRPALSVGYAYPFIQQEVLEETLTYLTDVFVFSWRFDREARLIGPDTPEGRMLETVRRCGGSPVLVLSSLDEEGRFDRERLS